MANNNESIKSMFPIIVISTIIVAAYAIFARSKINKLGAGSSGLNTPKEENV